MVLYGSRSNIDRNGNRDGNVSMKDSTTGIARFLNSVAMMPYQAIIQVNSLPLYIVDPQHKIDIHLCHTWVLSEMQP